MLRAMFGIFGPRSEVVGGDIMIFTCHSTLW
jgi:hypothetical protein